jgi:hypothetical protein
MIVLFYIIGTTLLIFVLAGVLVFGVSMLLFLFAARLLLPKEMKREIFDKPKPESEWLHSPTSAREVGYAAG